MTQPRAALVCLLLAATASASTVVRLEFDALSRKAARVIAGEIINVEARRDPNGLIYSDVTLAVEKSLPEIKAMRHTFRMVGGELDGQRQYISGMPQFNKGEHVILFLEASPASIFGPTVGLWQGIFYFEGAGAKRKIFDVSRRAVVGFQAHRLVRSLPASDSGALAPVDLDSFFREVQRYR